MVTEVQELLTDLTAPQCAAVQHRDGPLLVLAGPGSGKTTVVTRRIANLIAHGVQPWQILALTFTNKAAGEMRDRVYKLLGAAVDDYRAPTVSTFHSFCARQLRRFAEQAGLAVNYSIYDSADQRDAIKQSIVEAGLSSKNWPPGSVAASISNAKNKLTEADAYAAEANDFYTKSIAKIYRIYERRLQANDALDFDDLLMRMARMLRDSQELRERFQQRYQYLLIDEYQDTNHAQFVIAHSLACAHQNICVVGDPDQSIYGWRGADIGNILEFEEHFPNATVVPLGQNFRSTGHIVETAAGCEAAAPQTNGVHAPHLAGGSLDDHERRDILDNARGASHERIPADRHEMVQAHKCAQDGSGFHLDVAGQEALIHEQTFVLDDRVIIALPTSGICLR